MTTDPYAAQTRGRNAVLAAIGAAALIGVVLGVAGYAFLSKQGQRAPDVLARQSALPPPTLAKQGVAPPPALEKERLRMPADIRAYLEHVERIERKRADLSKRCLGTLFAVLPAAQQGLGLQGLKDLVAGAQDPENAPEPKTGVDEVKERAGTMRGQWDALNREFASVAPPAECAGLADSYGRTLRETGAEISDILDTVATASDDPSKAVAGLEAMKGQSKGIDQTGTQADREVGRICDKYETRKWFGISSDFGAGGDLLGMQGMGGSIPGGLGGVGADAPRP